MNRVKSDGNTETGLVWEQWAFEHAPKFLLFARQQARSEADAQDLVQEAVLECWRRSGTGEPPPIALVFATIRRRGIDLARSRNRRANREIAGAGQEADCWFDTEIESRERAQMIQSALSQLPAIYREAVILKIWGELTFNEIGEALAIPANTAASRYRYGLAELRKLTKEVLT